MPLKDELAEEMKDALKARDKTRLSTIRLIRDAITKREMEQGREALDDAGIIRVIGTMIRRSEEAVEDFKRGDREDLVEQENHQIEILRSFLPEQLSTEEIQSLMEEAIQEAGAAGLEDLGKVMKILMPKISGKADGRTVNQMARERLSN